MPTLGFRPANTLPLFLAGIGTVILAQSALAYDDVWNLTVEASALIQLSPPQILLAWPQDTFGTPNSYVVYRKSAEAASWGTGTPLPGTATNYADSNVTMGSAYEYQIVKNASTYTGYGYIYAGINSPLVEDRGKLILVVDNTYANDLTNELVRLQQDLIGDGWTVIRFDVARNETVPNVKAIIRNEYYADPANVKAVFLFGHVPVPYSGNIAPDEHVPAHKGAWPADVYYADMDGTWTDNTVSSAGATDPRNRNIRGDGKFDQSLIPSPAELQIGRVDLANMPGKKTYNGSATFPSELELLRSYLNKDHNFRHKLIDLPRRGLIHDSIGAYNGQGFAASGWRNFAPFFGTADITFLPNQGTWVATLRTEPYLWAYACGSGGNNSMNGIGATGPYLTAYTTDIVEADLKAAFVMLLGSWSGDWDAEDDFLRGVLAMPTCGLAAMWAGAPHWYCHHMALGETLGYSTRLTQNNLTNGFYRNQKNPYAGEVHVALMGDPTLRMHPVAPPTNLSGATMSGGVKLSWVASSDAVLGYHVYRATNPTGPFTRLTSALISGTNFTDSAALAETNNYMVRAVKLETSGSGTYYNASQGILLSVNASTTPNPPTVTVVATDPDASRVGSDPGSFQFTRTGSTSAALTVNYTLTGTAVKGVDYGGVEGDIPGFVTIPADAPSVTLTIDPVASSNLVESRTVVLTLSADPAYVIGPQYSATVIIGGNEVPVASITQSEASVTLTWPSASGRVFHLAYKDNLAEPHWADLGVEITASGPTVSWSDAFSSTIQQRFYRVFQVR